MKQLLAVLLALLMLSGCGNTDAEVTVPETTIPASISFAGSMSADPVPAREYESRFDTETRITLSDSGITVNGGAETNTVFTSRDIVYYEDREFYDSGNPYGEGEAADRHTAQEASAHTVVNITAPGAYRVSGKLSAGQLRIDLGAQAYFDSSAVVELILEDADITCTVAPAILFLNTYECDGNWSADSAQPDVDTTAAGANLILEGTNQVSGSYVARIYKDAEGEKKLWKQDGAIYSYMSLNVYGPGSLELTAENEGLDTELHLSIYGGNIAIYSGNDGINTNEDGVSVTSIHGGSVFLAAGLGAEGDGIDSNGYLVINGGTVVSAANPAADAGLDSDLGSYIHGGTVIALGSAMDWAEADSGQVTMNLQFASHASGSDALVVTKEDGTVVFAYDPSQDSRAAQHLRGYQGAILSCPVFRQGDTYQVYTGGTLTGAQSNGIYTAVTGYEAGTQMQYQGTEVGMMGRPGGIGEPPEGFAGELPEGMEPFAPAEGEWEDGKMPAMPEGMTPGEPPALPEGETMPADFDPAQMGGRGPRPGGNSENRQPPAGFDGQMSEGGFPGQMPQSTDGAGSTLFTMTDTVNAFSGVMPVAEATA